MRNIYARVNLTIYAKKACVREVPYIIDLNYIKQINMKVIIFLKNDISHAEIN